MMTKLGALGLVILLAVSCMSAPAGNSGNSGRVAGSGSAAIKPESLDGLVLVGDRKGDAIQYVFKAGGVLEYTLNGRTYTGTWKFDAKQPMMKYTIDWDEGGKKKGYLVDVTKNGDAYTIQGYWYITDAYIVLSDTVRVKE